MIRSSMYFFRLILSLGTFLPGEATAWACPQQADTPVPAVAEKNDGSPWHDLNLKFTGAQIVRARFRVKDEILFLQLPMPGQPRPTDDADSTANGLRKMTLRRVGKPGANELEGGWRVFQATLDGKEAVQFHGDELTFSKDTVEVYEYRSEQRYEAELELPQKTGSKPDGVITPAEILEEKFGAELERDSAGLVTSVSLLGRRKNESVSQFTSEHAEALKQLPDLQTLVIADHDFSDAAEDLKFLASLTKLEKLDLRKTNVNDAAMQNLASLQNLKILKLEYSFELTDNVSGVIARLQPLKELDLAFVPVSDRLIPALTSLESLERLYLYGTKVTDSGIDRLPELNQLSVLFVGSDEGADITDKALARIQRFASLRTLGIPGTQCTPAGLEQFRTQRPGCQLIGEDALVMPSKGGAAAKDAGVAEGQISLNEKVITFRHSCVWETTTGERTVKHVLLTEEPVDPAELAESYKRYGEDFTFAPFLNQLRLRIADDGKVISFHTVIDGRSIDQPGKSIELSLSSDEEQWKGNVQSTEPVVAGRSRISFKAEFTSRPVRITDSAAEESIERTPQN